MSTYTQNIFNKVIHMFNELSTSTFDYFFFFSSRRGPLVLFAETDFIKNTRSKSHRNRKFAHHNFNSPFLSPPPLKLGELKRSILAYGGTPEVLF